MPKTFFSILPDSGQDQRVDIYLSQKYPHLSRSYIQKLVKELKSAGAGFIEYVVGGDTSVISDSLFLTGADIIISDFVSDAAVFIEKSKNSSMVIRRNISPIVIENGSVHTPSEQQKARPEKLL